jgi:hypothetical protein
MRNISRLPFSIGFAIGVFVAAGLNWYSMATMYGPYKICFDCGMTAGFPFTMYNSGYLWGGEGYIASGVFANICFALIAGSIVGLVVTGLWQFVFFRLSVNRLN